ncbi:uncharacterized protein LOC134826368 [Bolinopsis microptera]|uniref:uncharacterized protein LOC134826368 n=1 Tax=Bolinopsis microptera TaxID=2820187 RepID=UPI00307AC137
MTILGCPCLNILIHIDKVEGKEEEGLTRVQLTLDGINIQQHFLVHEIKQGDWTIVKCKVCNCATHKKFSQEILLYPGLSDFTNCVLDVQSGPDFDTGFNLILPGEVASAKDNPSAKQDLLSIQTETDKLKKDMKVLYEEKLAQFIKTEKKLLDAGLRQAEEASMKIKNLVNYYHEKNQNEELTDSSNGGNETRSRKLSVSDKKVTFSVSDDVETAVEPDYQDDEEEEHPGRSPSQDEYFQFDMGDDDLFGGPQEDEFSGGYHFGQHDDDEDSSSSGCEPDMIPQGASVPINVPLGFHRERQNNKRISSSVKMEDIAHSMKTLMEEFHGEDDDVPRPRVMSRSYNPSRFRS